MEPSFREQHAGRRLPDSEECVSVVLLGTTPSIQYIYFTGRETTLEPTVASNRFRSYDDLLGRDPSMNQVQDYLVRRRPSLGLVPDNSSRYSSLSHHEPTESYQSTLSDEDEAWTSP